MKEYHEKRIELGFDRSPKLIFDEIERYTAYMIRSGWSIERGVTEQSLGYIDLIYYRNIDMNMFKGEV